MDSSRPIKVFGLAGGSAKTKFLRYAYLRLLRIGGCSWTVVRRGQIRSPPDFAGHPPASAKSKSTADTGGHKVVRGGHRRSAPDSDSVRRTVRQIISAVDTGGH